MSDRFELYRLGMVVLLSRYLFNNSNNNNLLGNPFNSNSKLYIYIYVFLLQYLYIINKV